MERRWSRQSAEEEFDLLERSKKKTKVVGGMETTQPVEVDTEHQEEVDRQKETSSTTKDGDLFTKPERRKGYGMTRTLSHMQKNNTSRGRTRMSHDANNQKGKIRTP